MQQFALCKGWFAAHKIPPTRTKALDMDLRIEDVLGAEHVEVRRLIQEWIRRNILAEVGRLFRVSKWTIRRWVEAGRIPWVRLGRRLLIPAEAVEKLVRGPSNPGRPPKSGTRNLRIARGPVPRPDFFDTPLGPAEINRLTRTVLAASHWGVALRHVGVEEGRDQEDHFGRKDSPAIRLALPLCRN